MDGWVDRGRIGNEGRMIDGWMDRSRIANEGRMIDRWMDGYGSNYTRGLGTDEREPNDR